MSRLSNKSIQLRVSSDGIGATLYRGWLRARVVAHARVAPQTAADGREGLRTGQLEDTLVHSIDSVLHELGKQSRLANAGLRVELSDELVHLDVVPGDFAGETERQLDSIASACVSELLGDLAGDHEIRWQLLPDRRHLLIGAIGQGLLDTLAGVAKRHRLSLRTVQPSFCVQWNRHARALVGKSDVFAVATHCEAVVAHVDNGSINHLSRGAWLDTPGSADTANPRVRQLMCELGLEPAGKAGVLDQRVDRLLASCGLRPEQQSSFLLVAPPLAARAVTSRWNVFDIEAAAP